MLAKIRHNYYQAEQTFDVVVGDWVHRFVFYLLLIAVIGILVVNFAPHIKDRKGAISCEKVRCIV